MSKTLEDDKPVDAVDLLQAQWQQFDPKLDTNAMQCVGRMFNLVSKWDAATNAMLKPHGINYTDFDIIATLCRAGAPHELTPTQLLTSVLLTSGAMTSALARLERTGLITRVDDAIDKRVKRAKLTTKGQRLARNTAAKRFKLANSQASNLSKNEQRTLESLLRKLSS